MAGVDHLPMPKPALLGRSTAGFWTRRDIYVIRLHQTNILTFLNVPLGGDGKTPSWREAHRIEVNPGSWFTPTTKDRLNRFLPGFSISSADGEWVIMPSGQWTEMQPFTGPLSIVGGKLPPCPDNPIRRRMIERNITRFVKFVEWLDFQPPAGEKGTILLTQDWVCKELQDKQYWRYGVNFHEPENAWNNSRNPNYPNYRPYDRTFTSDIIKAAMQRTGHRAIAHKLGSDRMKPALRKAVREYLRELTGLTPPASSEDLKNIA
jgi:hypothetical protein